METSIVEFNQSLYIRAMQKIILHLTHILIIGTHHCDIHTERHQISIHDTKMSCAAEIIYNI